MSVKSLETRTIELKFIDKLFYDALYNRYGRNAQIMRYSENLPPELRWLADKYNDASEAWCAAVEASQRKPIPRATAQEHP